MLTLFFRGINSISSCRSIFENQLLTFDDPQLAQPLSDNRNDEYIIRIQQRSDIFVENVNAARGCYVFRLRTGKKQDYRFLTMGKLQKPATSIPTR